MVKSYRDDGGKVRHRGVVNLGRADQFSSSDLDNVIRGLERLRGGTDDDRQDRDEGVTSVHVPDFGNVVALHERWVDLGLEDALVRGFRAARGSGRRKIDVVALVRAMTLYRLRNPSSKLGCLDWMKTVAMPGMPATVTHQRLLCAMGALMDHSESVEAGIARQVRPLVD